MLLKALNQINVNEISNLKNRNIAATADFFKPTATVMVKKTNKGHTEILRYLALSFRADNWPKIKWNIKIQKINSFLLSAKKKKERKERKKIKIKHNQTPFSSVFFFLFLHLFFSIQFLECKISDKQVCFVSHCLHQSSVFILFYLTKLK